jgi:hypothetical protein
MIDSRVVANGAVIDQSGITHQFGEVPSPRESKNFDSIIRMRFPMAIKSSIKANKEELTSSLRFIAVVVSDLRTAEQFYKGVFEMEVIGHEAMLNDGLWYTLPFDKGWKAPVINESHVKWREKDEKIKRNLEKGVSFSCLGRLSLLISKLRNFPNPHRSGIQGCHVNFVFSNAA